MKHFQKSFAGLFEKGSPEHGMHFEKEGFVNRYYGAGKEAHYYSLSLSPECPDDTFEKLVLEELCRAKTQHRSTFEWKTYDIFDQGFAGKILKENGFHLKRTSRLMFAEPSKLGSDIKDQVRTKKVSTSQDFEELMVVNKRAFCEENEWLRAGLQHEVLNNYENVGVYLSYIGQNLAAAGWIKIYNQIGYLFGGGTDPTFRGKGAYKALVAARSAHAKAKNLDFLASECSPQSEPILASLGFDDGKKSYQWVYHF